MTPKSQNEKIYYLLILIAGALLCFINLGGHPIYIFDEAKNAGAAREMFVNNNWLIPMFNDELRTDKPVLHYWFMMLAYKIFGVSAFSARFFSAVFGVLTLFSTYHYVSKFISRRVGLITAFILSASIFFIQEFHLAVPDPYLIFFVSFGLFNFYDFEKNGKRSSWLVFYISLGLGTLAKGPVAIALPGLIVLIYLLAKKEFNWKKLKKLNPILGGMLTLLVAAPWFWLVHKATDGAFTEGFFLKHNIQRFGGEMEGHGGLPFVTWAFVLLGLLPFSFFIVQGFIRGWKKRKSNDFALFSFIVSVVFIGFFSISMTKLPNYPMPSYPFVAVLVAVYLSEFIAGKVSVKGYKISLWTLLVIAIALPVGGFLALKLVETQLYHQRFLGILLAILPVGVLLGLYYLYKGKLKESVIVIGMSAMFLTLELFQFVYPKLVDQSPVVLAGEYIDKDSLLMIYKGYDPAFMFNYERTIPLSNKKEDILEFVKTHPDGLVMTKEKIFNLDWKEEQTEVIFKQKAIFENYTIVLFKVK